jgi:hypothetical protein
MDIRDLRIGDIVCTKAFPNNKMVIKALDGNDEVVVKMDSYNECTYSIHDVCGFKVDKAVLKSIGCEFNMVKVEYILSLGRGYRTLIKPQMGSENYIAMQTNVNRPFYFKFTYLHQLQHWLWDNFKFKLE